MNDTLRYIVCAILIFIIIVLQPYYLEWLGYGSVELYETKKDDQITSNKDYHNEDYHINTDIKNVDNEFIKSNFKTNSKNKSFITVISPLYTTTISNQSGGSFTTFIINNNNNSRKYIGGYDQSGIYSPDIPVSLIMPQEELCTPCLGAYDERNDQYIYFTQFFEPVYSYSNDTIFINDDEQVELTYKLNNNNETIITKSIILYGNSFKSNHSFAFNQENLNLPGSLELIWKDGLRPTEEKADEDVLYGYGIINQAGEVEDIQMKSIEKPLLRQSYLGQTNWAAIRTKYFITSIIAKEHGSYATLASKNTSFGTRDFTPVYSTSIGFSHNLSYIESIIYLGPLEVDLINSAESSLDATMNLGWGFIRPISKGILWFLKFIHNTININYGFVILIFACLIRVITGPLTKMSFKSNQNMQKVQPELKKIQAKYKGNPQALNKETMALYKKHKINPAGGCLPILIQMPILYSLFIVFRTTIEFRGAPFLFWIQDLSKPDVVFSLPFSIPIYGDGVAILPLIMGITLLLTTQISSASMDSSQKPIMYFMNGFFILLFNTFPSGLNLYYTAYNLLNFFQQRNIRSQLNAK